MPYRLPYRFAARPVFLTESPGAVDSSRCRRPPHRTAAVGVVVQPAGAAGFRRLHQRTAASSSATALCRPTWHRRFLLVPWGRPIPRRDSAMRSARSASQDASLPVALAPTTQPSAIPRVCAPAPLAMPQGPPHRRRSAAVGRFLGAPIWWPSLARENGIDGRYASRFPFWRGVVAFFQGARGGAAAWRGRARAFRPHRASAALEPAKASR